MRFKILIIVSSAAILSGCFATKIKNPDQYRIMKMERADVFPTEVQLENRPYRVVIFDVNDKALMLAREAKSGASVSNELARHVSQSNAVVVSKVGLENLKSAIDARSASYKNTAEVDYALTGNITVAKYTKKYVKVKYTKDKEGKVHVTEPYCNHGTLLQGAISIYNVRTMKLAHSFRISAGSQKIETLKRNQSHLCRKLTNTQITNYLWSDGTSAARREDVQLKNFFRPKGYVLERRAKDDENIFRISIGISSGVIKDQDVVFYTINDDKNPVTGKISQIQKKLGEGTVSDKVYEKHSWVLVEDKDIASKIKLGDIVKVVYEKSFMDKIFNRSFSN